jgi:hypothetical protein
MFITRPIGDKLSTHKAGEGAKIDCDTMDSESFSEFLQNSLSAADFGHLFTNEEEEDEGRNDTYYSQGMYDPPSYPEEGSGVSIARGGRRLNHH